MAGGHGGTFTNRGSINSTSSSPPAAGDIVILADAMMLRFTSTSPPSIEGSITAGSGRVAGYEFDPTVLGTPAPAGSLNLLQADLDSISAGQLQIGYRNIDARPR
jgi:hypothetical protein